MQAQAAQRLVQLSPAQLPVDTKRHYFQMIMRRF